MIIPASWLTALIWFAHIAVSVATLFLLGVLVREWRRGQLW